MVELGSFVAHRRRTQGEFHWFVKSSVQAVRSGRGLLIGMDAQPIYPTDAILSSINSALDSVAIAAIPESLAEGMAFCLISLLQGVTFADHEDQDIGRLFFAFNASEIFSMAGIRIGRKEEQIGARSTATASVTIRKGTSTQGSMRTARRGERSPDSGENSGWLRWMGGRLPTTLQGPAMGLGHQLPLHLTKGKTVRATHRAARARNRHPDRDG